MASDQCGHPDGCNNHINRVVVLHPKETAKITAESLLHLLLCGYFDYKEPMQKTGLQQTLGCPPKYDFTMANKILGIQGYGKQGMNGIETYSLGMKGIRVSLLRYEPR